VTPRGEFFSFGNVAIDDLVYADGSTMWEIPGGGAVYAALGMALWTGSAAVAAPSGADYPRERFSALDFRASRRIPHSMRNWGLYETDGSRHFITRRDSLPWEAFSSDTGELDAGPYPYCHIAPMPMRRAGDLIAALRGRGARAISVDPHERELAAHGLAGCAALLAGATIFMPSRQDCRVLFGGIAPLDALRALRARFAHLPVIAVKCDADGALVHAAGTADVVTIPSAGTSVVDATGAGDSFCGGFLAGYAADGDIAEAALRGTVAASFALAAVGPAALSAATPALAEARLAALRPRLGRIAL
jgi:sugar/nucleoside kinase (ribokinase family)